MTPTYEPERDFYKLLGLTPTTASSEQVIRQAYLKCGMPSSLSSLYKLGTHHR